MNLTIKIFFIVFLALNMDVYSQGNIIKEVDNSIFSIVLKSNSTFDFSDTIKNENYPSKEPWRAVIRSAIIPGWGQFYNESYWKIPIIFGVFGWFAYNWKINNDSYLDYRDKYLNSLNSGIENPNFKILRDFYRDERDLFLIYLSLTYALNILDAYVDAHLFNFDILTKKNSLLINLKYNF